VTQPAQSFPVTIEQAWKRLMTTMGRDNMTRASQQQIAVKGIRQIMGRR
jgi:hypothetical protein